MKGGKKPVPYSLKLQGCNFQLVPGAVERNTSDKLKPFPTFDDSTYIQTVSPAREKGKSQVSYSRNTKPILVPGRLPGLAALKDLCSGQAL